MSMGENFPSIKPISVEVALNADFDTLQELLDEHYDNAQALDEPLINSDLENSVKALEFIQLLHDLVSSDNSSTSWQAGYQAYHFAYAVSGALGLDTSGLYIENFGEIENHATRDKARRYLHQRSAEYFQKNPSVKGLVDAYLLASDDGLNAICDIASDEEKDSVDNIYDIENEHAQLVRTMAGLAFLQIERSQPELEANKFHDQLASWNGDVDS